MAGNKTIFDLPLRTGVTADDRLAIVDSGNTLTSSVKVSDLRDGTGVNTLETLTGDITFSGTNIDISTNGQTIVLSGCTGGGGGGKYIAADGTNNIVPDYYATTSINSASSENAIVAGTGNTITNSTGNYGFIGGGSNNNIETGNYNSIVGGSNNIVNGFNSNTIGGTNNEIDSSNCAADSIVAGSNNFMTNEDFSLIGGGLDNDINNGGRNSMIGGANNLINESTYCGMIAGRYNILNGAQLSSIVNSYVGKIYGDYRLTPLNITNSTSSNIRQTAGTGTGRFEGTQSAIFNSDTCDIAGQVGNETTLATIIGSNNTNITGGTNNTIMIGTSGRTGLNSYTTYVETLEAFTHVVLNDYSNLNFSGDTAAAASGVPLGGLYHDNGDLRVRIT